MTERFRDNHTSCPEAGDRRGYWCLVVDNIDTPDERMTSARVSARVVEVRSDSYIVEEIRNAGFGPRWVIRPEDAWFVKPIRTSPWGVRWPEQLKV